MQKENTKPAQRRQGPKQELRSEMCKPGLLFFPCILGGLSEGKMVLNAINIPRFKDEKKVKISCVREIIF